MSVYPDDVHYWVTEWATTGEIISDAIAAKILDYWQITLDDLPDAIPYARNAGFDTVTELLALEAWAQTSGEVRGAA
jgi:hypothetical protein